ncbi:MAG: hypothetical protein J5857_06710 [Treponema sp.]|nr:hypothetical protein [Treponema sp.]
MKGKVLFLENGDGEVVIGKVILLIVNVVLTLIGFLGGEFLHFYFLLLPPFSIFYLVVTIYYIVKSTVNHVFELHSLFFLPFLISVTFGALTDISESNQIKKNLLDAQSYVEQYYKQNGSLPDNDDPYLAEHRVQIEGIDSYDKYIKADEYIKHYLEENDRFPPEDDPYLMELRVQIDEVETYAKYVDAQKYIQQYHYIYGKAPEEDDHFLMGLDPDIYNDEYYYELKANGAELRRGEKSVHFRPRP